MVERGREVLFGKLAIGRGVLSRDAAVRCFHATAGEPLWERAVREGLIPRTQADDLLELVDHGVLSCRGTCGFERVLRGEPPASDRCERCGGLLHVRRGENGTLSTAPTWRGRDAAAPREAPAPAPEPAPAPPAPPSDSLPSAIPIPAPGRPIAPPEPDSESRRYGGGDFAPFSIRTGTTVYEVLAPIGKGGMGSVYRARHRGLNAIVAIKVLTNATLDQRKRFDREIKTMAKLDHPNVVRVMQGGVIAERGDFEGAPFFAMEYVPGRDLATWVQERPRTPGACAAMLVTICEAIHFAHNRGIVHRDLKPANVIVTHEGDVPKICDFGLAKVASHDETDITQSGAIMGTPQFMPPEQMLGKRLMIGPPTDVYSLGAMLYFLLTGAPPFVADKLLALMGKVVREPVAPVRKKNPACPPELDAVVLKALEKEPPARFHTARDFGRALAGLSLPL